MQSVRTNNGVEGYHNRLNKIHRRVGLDIYSLADLLYKEADLSPLHVHLVASAKLDQAAEAAGNCSV